jgi:hypothetical protein
MNVVVIVAQQDKYYGAPMTAVVSVCENWNTAQKEKKKLTENNPGVLYNLIEKSLIKEKYQ